MERLIFHIDVNSAFLSWESARRVKQGLQDLRDIPACIGGDPKKRTGIVVAKSIPAKKYGIQTGEPMAMAIRKCPELVIVKSDFELYIKCSRAFKEICASYAPVMESFSIDEVFLDMTGTSLIYPDPIQTAHEIKDKIKNELGFTVNVGISTNKLLAKMASDFEKPDKVHTLLKEEVEEKLWPLNVGDLFMVGKRTTEELNKLNIFTIKDLAMASDKILERQFKNQARYLKEAAWGIDNTKVEPRSSKTTSISTTETLTHDYTDEEKLKDILFRQTEDVTRELRKQKQYAKTVAVIYKNNSFRNYSAQSKLSYPTNSTKEIYKLVIEIFNKSYKKDPIRLIGVRLADLQETKERQLTLFEENTIEEDQEEEIQKTIDDINQKFGKSIVAPASLKIIGNPKSKRNMKN